ncbi:MAG: hypothetical protein SPL13_04300 [Clostridia bacterium]|nr:hypothetical protein [Clostridia bacterium]
MFKNKFDYLFIKNKVLNNALEQAKYSISLLYTEEGIVQGQEQAAISKALSKQIAWDLSKGVKQGIKFVKAQRKRFLKAGLIDPELEKIKFLCDIGVLNSPPFQEDTSSESAENLPTETETSATDDQTTEQQESSPDKPENEQNTDETTTA